MVTEWFEWQEYELGMPLAEFERACWDMRCQAESEGSAAGKALAKALAVALVGKLHAYTELWEEVEPDYNDPIAGHWWGPDGHGGMVEYRAIGGQVSRKRRVDLAATALPAIPLWIWSHGRNWLWERMSCAGLSEIIYADTDGLMVTPRGWNRLVAKDYIRDNEWGELRHVAGPVEIEVFGPKCVRIGEEIVAAGRPKRQRDKGPGDNGYWFRAPIGRMGSALESGVWEEHYREYA